MNIKIRLDYAITVLLVLAFVLAVYTGKFIAIYNLEHNLSFALLSIITAIFSIAFTIISVFVLKQYIKITIYANINRDVDRFNEDLPNHIVEKFNNLVKEVMKLEEDDDDDGNDNSDTESTNLQ